MTSVDVKKGLPIGTYLISRSKHPKQNHKITSRIQVFPDFRKKREEVK
jgi:hypothetical protein